MAAYIDEYRNRFKVGPICRVLSESLGCGFLAPRGYRMVESRPVSRMRARHEALARGVMGIHAVLLQCLFDRFGSVFPQCGLMVFPGVVIVSR